MLQMQRKRKALLEVLVADTVGKDVNSLQKFGLVQMLENEVSWGIDITLARMY